MSAEAEPSVCVLIRGLLASDPSVVSAAIRSLEELGPGAAPAADELVRILGGRDRRLRKEAAEAVVTIGAEAVAALLAALPEASEPTAKEILRALGRMGLAAASAVSEVEACLASNHRGIRAAAARVLGRLGPSAASALPSLTAALADEDGQVRTEAADTLRACGAVAAPKLVEFAEAFREAAFRADGLSSRVQRVLTTDVARLGHLGLRARTLLPGSYDRAIHLRAIRATARIGPDAIPALVVARDFPDAQVRVAAANALVEITRSRDPKLEQYRRSIRQWFDAEQDPMVWRVLLNVLNTIDTIIVALKNLPIPANPEAARTPNELPIPAEQ